MPTSLGFASRAQIAATQAGLADVLVEPWMEFFDAREKIADITAQKKNVGHPFARWSYPDRLLTGTEYRQLKSLVGNTGSATVFIRTLTNEPDAGGNLLLATYEAVMTWPDEAGQVGLLDRFSIEDPIEFTLLSSYGTVQV